MTWITNLDSLISELKTTTVTSKFLDSCVAAAFGYTDCYGQVWSLEKWAETVQYDNDDWKCGVRPSIVNVIPFTTSIDAALTLLPANCGIEQMSHTWFRNEKEWTVQLHVKTGFRGKTVTATSKTLPMAMCIAFLESKKC